MKKVLILTLFLIPALVLGQKITVKTKGKNTPWVSVKKAFVSKNVYRIDSLDFNGVLLNKGWKFSFGDNPAWAKPSFADTLKWKNYDLDAPMMDFGSSDKNEIGWFRKKIYIDSSLVGEPLIFKHLIAGAAEVYLNGELIHAIGTIETDPAKAKTRYFGFGHPYAVSFKKPGEQVLAVRFLFSHYTRQKVDIRFEPFSIRLRRLAGYVEDDIKDTLSQNITMGICVGLLLMMGLIHYFFHRFFRSQRYNRLFSWAMFLFAVFFYTSNGPLIHSSVERYFFITLIRRSIFPIAHLLLLTAVYDYLQQHRRWLYGIFVAVFIVCQMLILYNVIDHDFSIGMYLLLIVNYIYLIRQSVKAKQNNGKVLRDAVLYFMLATAILFVIFIIAVIIYSINNRYQLDTLETVFSPIIVLLFLVGPQLSVSASVSFSLAKDFVKTNAILAQKLNEIEALSAEKQQILAQQNETLEHQVAQRTEELGKSLKDLQEAQNQLIQKEKLASLGELTAGIAHEIQNPLNFVNNFSELSVDIAKDLEEELNRPDADKGYIEELLTDLTQNQQKINHHGKRASSIVKGMLEHSRAGTGEKQMTDLNALCDEYLRLSYHGMRARDKSFNADFEFVAAPNLPLISIVPQDISRVVLNLINNAFQSPSLPNGVIKKVIVATQFLEESSVGVITVSDNGSGIPDSIKDKIFQPFFTTKPTGEGTGLGLSLSYDIVTKGHGGSLEVQSKEGEGTTFTVKLPIVSA